MDNNIKIWLFDILNSINEIESYFVNTPRPTIRSLKPSLCRGTADFK